MKVKIVVPSELSDIKLSQYQKFIRTTKDSEDDNFIARQMVGIFCNLPDEVVGTIRAKDFTEIVNQIAEVLKSDAKFVERFTINHVEYGFIPKLDDITLDEKADLDTFNKDVKDMHKAMGVLYRPITTKYKDKYLIKNYEPGVELDVTLDIAFGANVFFYNLMKDLLNYTQKYIQGQVIHNKQVQEILEKNGVGINPTIHSLKVISENLMKWVS